MTTPKPICSVRCSSSARASERALDRLVPVAGDERAAYIAGLLREADLSYLIQLDPVHQLEYFLSERLQLMDEVSERRSRAVVLPRLRV